MEKVSGMAEKAMKERTRKYISQEDKKRFSRNILGLCGALICLVAGLIFSQLFPTQDIVAGAIYVLGVLIIGVPIFVTAITGIVNGDTAAAMEILVSIAMIICVLDNQFTIAILIPVILTFVHFLEEKSILGGRDAIDGLKQMQGSTALLITDEGEVQVDAKQLNVGDIIRVMPGTALPIDGKVIEGKTNIDQKSLTGEPLPQAIESGDQVFAGTVNIDGVITVRVDKPYMDTSFQKIVKLLDDAEKITTPETRVVDRFMSYYIPLALIIATLVWLFTQDISKAVAILVVSCPCGHMLISSAPMIAALSTSTKRGLLIKNAAFIEKLAEIDYMVFDKTGTITNGMLEASNYYLAEAESFEEMVETACIVTENSLHPVSCSISALSSQSHDFTGWTITEHIGKGMEGVHDASGDRILVGNHKWFAELGYELVDTFEGEGVVNWVIKNGKILGCILLKDVPRDDASHMIEELKALGIKETVLLTGDNARSAERICRAVGIENMCCGLLPEEKLDKVTQLMEQGTVCVVGDGINDALALSRADVGIAMGAMGSDTAIQSADIALMNNKLSNICFSVYLAQRTKSVIFENIILSFAISFIMIFLAAAGVVNPLAGAFLHNIGAFFVLLNSGRLLKNPQKL